MWNRPCASLWSKCGVSPSDACHKICAPETGAPFALTSSPSRPPGFCLATELLGTCACVPPDTKAAAHKRKKIFRRVRRIANRLPESTTFQSYLEESKPELLVTR